MSNRAGHYGAALSLLVVSALVLGALFAFIAISPAARAGPCDQVGGVITGDWTITTPQTCSGIVYSVDGTININAGGSLTLINGGLRFTMDSSHAGYSLNVNAGGTLVLDASIVTTEPNAINPHVHLPLTVSGANSIFTMRNGAVLKFPGWFNATNAAINVTDSTITGFDDSELAGTGLDIDATNDGPVIDWAATTANLYRSRIERIYENTTAEGNVNIGVSSTFAAYDTYIGVDYYNDVVQGCCRHNALAVDGTSVAYLFGATIDRAQDPSSKTDWRPAFVPAAGGNVYLLRWARVITVDSTGFPVSGALVAATLSPSNTVAAYPDNGLGTAPSSRTLWFLGRTATGANAWDRTNQNGEARIPLYTDQITSATLPNAESFGNYAIAATFSGSTVNGGAGFPAYPSVALADNTRIVPLGFNIQVRTGPDLELRSADYPPSVTVIQSQPFTVQVVVRNEGQTTATSTDLAAYLNNRSNLLVRVTVPTILAGSQATQPVNIPGLAVAGTANLMLWVDPDNVQNEGGIAQEANNIVNVSLFVQPPPAGYVAIGAPDNAQQIQPGTQLSVSGFVRQSDATGIFGIGLNIQLRQAGNSVASATTTSGDGGAFSALLDVPGGLSEGSYDLYVTSTATNITEDHRAVRVASNLPLLSRPLPFLGIPLWLFLIILAAAAAIGIGVTLYIKVYGLGKMVECGECGAFIPEDATSCPKCGVEFEKDMAKCSNCQAWIPVDVKQCPECGVEFATGEVEMADYQEKMRLQYDEVVTKFKDEASRQLGRALSDREFQEWWRKQPTFVTFEDWLREEEEMRKMGSKPCPTCGTLNSVTATVCHKCGSLMRESPRPPAGGSGGGSPPVIQARRSGGASEPPSGGAAAPFQPSGSPTSPSGTESIPRRVIRKPSAPQPVVQKKVVKKPMGESQEGEGQSDSSGNQSEDEL
jgi:ribosomal protein L40E